MKLCPKCERYKYSILFSGSFCYACQEIEFNWFDDVPRSFIRKLEYGKSDSIKQYICEYLKRHPCMECGEQDIRVLEFDHVDPEFKSWNIATAVNYTVSELIDEIKKCRILCANCHRKHHNENSYKSMFLKQGGFIKPLPSAHEVPAKKETDIAMEIKALGFTFD